MVLPAREGPAPRARNRVPGRPPSRALDTRHSHPHDLRSLPTTGGAYAPSYVGPRTLSMPRETRAWPSLALGCSAASLRRPTPANGQGQRARAGSQRVARLAMGSCASCRAARAERMQRCCACHPKACGSGPGGRRDGSWSTSVW